MSMDIAYPAILYPMEDNPRGYTVEVPDLPGCVTEGKDLAQALLMARDAIGGWVLDELEAGRRAPVPSDPRDIRPEEGGFVSCVAVDMDDYAARYGSKCVRKNVTLPGWLETWAEGAGVNYSRVLTDALERRYAEGVPA